MIHTLLFAMPQDSYEESDAVNGDTFKGWEFYNVAS